jgi:Kef-type K+ transport system membrane component KefB
MIILVARLWLVKKIGQPTVIGEIIAGCFRAFVIGNVFPGFLLLCFLLSLWEFKVS